MPSPLGRMKERKEESGRDQQPWWGAEGEGRSPHSEKPLTGGKSAGTERDLQGIGGERSRWSVEGRTE